MAHRDRREEQRPAGDRLAVETGIVARCRLAARLLALFYDWWNIFVRLASS